MRYHKKISACLLSLAFTVIACVLVFSCASHATLTGGDKDIQPPFILATKPENYTKNFKGKEIKLRFNEYFSLASPIENIIITPSLNENPDYYIKGKSLIIKFKEKLDSNTTYTIILAEAVKDITEGNMLLSDKFVFSTGNAMDSCMLAGVLKDAYTMEPKSKIAIMLYESTNDSAPIIERPVYYTYTDSKGNFEFHHLPKRSFLIFALKDNNFNKQFDLPDEEIAFYDAFPTSYEVPMILVDSVEVIDNEFIDSNKIELFLFMEKDTTLKFLRRTLVKDNYHHFIFSSPIDQFQLLPLQSIGNDAYLWRLNKTKDTVDVYFKDTINEEIDFIVMANDKVFDTVTFNPSAKKQAAFQRKRRDTTDVKRNTFNPTVLHQGEINKRLLITFDYPVKEVDLKQIQLLELLKDKRQIVLKDTNDNDSIVEIDVYDTLSPIIYFEDSLYTNLVVDYQWKYNKNYRLFCNDSVFISYFGTYNDTMDVMFKTKIPKDYGEFRISYQLTISDNHIVQLINEKEEIIKEHTINSDTTIIYEFLDAGKYKIRIIIDSNRNNKWDTGKYLEKQQPEKIIYFSKPIDIKPNWTIEEEFLVE